MLEMPVDDKPLKEELAPPTCGVTPVSDRNPWKHHESTALNSARPAGSAGSSSNSDNGSEATLAASPSISPPVVSFPSAIRPAFLGGHREKSGAVRLAQLVVKDVAEYASDVLSIFIGVLQYGLWLLKIPIVVLGFLYLVAVVCYSSQRYLPAVITPLGSLPVVGQYLLVYLARYEPFSGTTVPLVDFSSLVGAQTRSCTLLLEESYAASEIALKIQHTDYVIVDLVSLVRDSNLTQKTVIANTLQEFQEDTRRVTRLLLQYKTHVTHAVDSITAWDSYALSGMERAHSALLSENVYALISGNGTEVARVHQVISASFEHVMTMTSQQATLLTKYLTVLVSTLDSMKQSLTLVHENLLREDSTLQVEQDNLLVHLWVALGINGKQTRIFRERGNLLETFQSAQRLALTHVVNAEYALKAMEEDLKKVRERSLGPALSSPFIPLEVQMNSIRSGVERLKSNQRSTCVPPEASRV